MHNLELETEIILISVAKYTDTIPSITHRLLRVVIEARKAGHALFLRIASKTQDPEIERSNASHKKFIDTSTAVFNPWVEKYGLREQILKPNLTKSTIKRNICS